MRRKRWLRRAVVVLGLLVITLFLALSSVPTVPYRPWCHAEGRYIEGPLRTVWVDRIETLMDEAGMIYLRRDDRLWQPYFTTFDGWFSAEHQLRPWTRFDIRRNLEWRIVSSLAHGIRPGSQVPVETLPTLQTAMRDRASLYGIDPPIDTFEEKAIYDDCMVKRAAAIRAENPARN